MGFKSQIFTASGNFTVPPGVSFVWMMAQGSGGAGAGNRSDITNSTQAGGGGEFVNMLPIAVNPGDVLAVTVGAGGVSVPATSGGNGGTTSFNGFNLLGGIGGGFFVFGGFAFGGGPNGAGGSASFGDNGAAGTAESPCHFGGASSGAQGGNTNAGNSGQMIGQWVTAGGIQSAPQQVGGTGGSSILGAGGVGGATGAGSNGGIGSGGGGAASIVTIKGGDGGDARVVISWIAR